MTETKNSTTTAKQSVTAKGKKTTETKKTETAKKKSNYTRAHAFCDSLKKGGSIKQVAEQMLSLYQKRNPDAKKASQPTAEWVCRDYLAPLLIMGYVTEETVEGSKEKTYSLKQ